LVDINLVGEPLSVSAPYESYELINSSDITIGFRYPEAIN